MSVVSRSARVLNQTVCMWQSRSTWSTSFSTAAASVRRQKAYQIFSDQDVDVYNRNNSITVNSSILLCCVDATDSLKGVPRLLCVCLL